MRLLYVLPTLLTLAASSPVLEAREDQHCNGYAAFCNRKYSNVTLVGTHDAPFNGSIADARVNQEKTVADQLAAGIRYLTAQTHLGPVKDFTVTHRDDVSLRHTLNPSEGGVTTVVPDPGTVVTNKQLHVCHTSCFLLDRGTLKNFLTTVKTFLDGNPDEVVTVLLTNGDNVDISIFDAVFKSIPSLTDYAFVPSTSPKKLAMSDWPTYAELISSGKRLITFLDYGANETKVNYILDEFTYYFETPFDTTDPSFNQCDINRPPNTPSADGRMYIVNHFLDKKVGNGILIPDNDKDFQTNAATGNGSIGAQSDLCEAKYGRKPNVVLVDMFDRGDVFKAQDDLNNLNP